MGCSIITTFFLTIGVYVLLQHQHHSLVQGAPTSDATSENGGSLVDAVDRIRGYGRPMLVPRVHSSRPAQYIRNHLLQAEPHNSVDDFILDDEDVIDFNKRQSEDYGHMRFGKRGDKFDDYGHMRFGRSLEG